MRRINTSKDLYYIETKQRDIEKLIKENSKQIGEGRYLVDKNLYLDNLVIHGKDRGLSIDRFTTYFSDKRINNIFIRKCFKFSRQIDAGDIFSEFLYMILKHIKNIKGDYIEINYNKGKREDDLSGLIFKLDVRTTRLLLTKYLDKVYNPNKKKEERYLPKYGDFIISLDDYCNDNASYDKTQYYEMIGENDTIRQVSNTEFNYEEIERIKEEAELTERQRELCDILLITDTQKEASELMGIKEKSVQRMLQRVKNNIERNNVKINTANEVNKKIMIELDRLLSTDFEEEELLEYIKDNIKNMDIERLVYKVESKYRVPFIRYMKGKKIQDEERSRFLKEFLKEYYN